MKKILSPLLMSVLVLGMLPTASEAWICLCENGRCGPVYTNEGCAQLCRDSKILTVEEWKSKIGDAPAHCMGNEQFFR